jgi:hypothetical protein
MNNPFKQTYGKHKRLLCSLEISMSECRLSKLLQALFSVLVLFIKV